MSTYKRSKVHLQGELYPPTRGVKSTIWGELYYIPPHITRGASIAIKISCFLLLASFLNVVLSWKKNRDSSCGGISTA